MGRAKSPRLRRVSSHVRVGSGSIQVDSTFDFEENGELEHGGEDVGRRIMVVVDSIVEAKCALQWALSHTVQKKDTIVLLHVANSSKQGKKSVKKRSPRILDLLHSMKDMSQKNRPEVQIEIALAEGKDLGVVIVEEVKKQGVSLLVLRQRKRSVMWRATMCWRRNRGGGGGVVEYCIENANCMTVAVRRKKSMGGYLITTKRHKDFWLLA